MGVALAEKPEVAEEKRDEKRERLLRLLTYEVVDGRPIYYRGYRDVLEGKKQPEEVMGASFFHADLVGALVWFLRDRLGGKYRVVAGELGYLIEGGWRNLDVAVFRYDDVKDKLRSRRYIDVPPVLVVEVDTHGDVGNEMTYISGKVEDLLRSGVEKVVWIFTDSEKVLIAERGKDWVIAGWDRDIDLLEGLKLNLEDLLKQP